MDRYDVVIIGSGPGGYVCAIRCAQLGLKTAIIEKEPNFGGTCLNTGCIPSKALLDSTELLVTAKSGMNVHGINLPAGEVTVDLKRMMARKDAVVGKMTGGVKALLSGNGIAAYYGAGRLKGGGLLSVEKNGATLAELQAGRIVLATGSVPIELPGIPFDGTHFVDSTGALSFDSVPPELAVVGAGAIGLEIGSVWNRLGSKVTIIEIADQILPRSDTVVCNRLMRILGAQGLKFLLSTRVKGVTKTGGRIALSLEDGKGNPGQLSCDRVLVAAGRRPYTAGLDLEKAGVKSDVKSGRITVDEKFRTTAENVYAIGDLVSGPMLAHKASEDGIAVAETIATGHGSVNYGTVPSVVYTWPEYAFVGPGENELTDKGIPHKTGIFQFRANGRALSCETSEGYARIYAEKDGGRILSAQIIGPWASDLIHEIVVVMEFGGNTEDIARITHAHPTLSEVVRESAQDAEGRSIHSLKKVSLSQE